MTPPRPTQRSVKERYRFDRGQGRSAVSEGEYARRLQEIDSALYTHVGGTAAAETGRGGTVLVPAHGSR